MNIKKSLVTLIFGVIATYGNVNAASPILEIIPAFGTSPKNQVNPNETRTIYYRITNLSNQPHRVLFKNTYPPRAVLQVGRNSNPCGSRILQHGESCQLQLEIEGSRVPPGGFGGGPEACLTTRRGVCSRPNPINELSVNQ